MDRYVPLPPLPARISRLNELAYDLWWSWNAEARDVFRDLDYPLWTFTDHNPVLLLHLVETERLEHAAADPEFQRLYDQAVAALDLVRAGAGTWWSRQTEIMPPVVFTAPAFSLHQALPLDSDGPAVAAGDFLKEASDLGVPVVAVGLMHPRSYEHQRLSGAGWQEESNEILDWSDMPITPASSPGGSRMAFAIEMPGEPGDVVHVQVWQVRAGRATLYLLDPSALTIGYASRVGDDLRPDVIFRDAERLAAILTARRRPVQIVFAGRAHADDDAAKRHLQRLFTRALDPMFGGRIAFLEDYDQHAARLLVQGCDLWLSMPAAGGPAPLGALKAAINGVPAVVIEALPRVSARRAVKATAERLYNPALRNV